MAVVGIPVARVSATFTRPNDTTAYVTGDVVANSTSAAALMTFAVGVANGNSGAITRVQVETNDPANVAQYRLWLYTVSNPTHANDNAAFVQQHADAARLVGTLDIPALSASGGDAASGQSALTLPLDYVCDAADVNLYGLLETRSGFTPVANRVYTVTLWIRPN
jgi:hypothetical protein